MKTFCTISGLEFEVPFFSEISFAAHEIVHPIFYLPQKKLLAQTANWAKGKFSEEENYLLFLALLRSTGLVHFRVPAQFKETTENTVAESFERLLKACLRISAVPDAVERFPHWTVTWENADLFTAPEIIKLWLSEYKEFKAGIIRNNDFRELAIRETALQRMLKSPGKQRKDYAKHLASWAAKAANFPDKLVRDSNYKELTSQSEIWQKIIIQSCNPSIHKLPDADEVRFLIEYLEANLPRGTIFSKEIFSILDSSVQRKVEYLGEEVDFGMTSFELIIPDGKGEEELQPPKLENFGSKLEYLRAKLSFDMAKNNRRAKSVEFFINKEEKIRDKEDPREAL